jgi:hypothetical protein
MSTTTIREQAPYLDTFPAEIIEIIASFLSTKDLRNIRQVNKTISNATAHHFVKEFIAHPTVDFSFDGLQRLTDISLGCYISGEIQYGKRIQSFSFV